jgi:DNA repair protein RecO (recombination protein O)
MPIREAEAIVLRHYALAEADRIIVLLTREFGKIRAVAKGIKKTRSRLAGVLEPLNHVRLEFYAREGRDLSYIRQCDIVHSYLGRNPSLEGVCVFTYFAEIAQEFVQDDQPNEVMFRLLLAVLAAGDISGVNPALVRYFELWALKLAGFLPNYDYCSTCGSCVKESGFYARVETGEVRCARCARGAGLLLRPESADALRRVSELPPQVFAAQPLPVRSSRELERLTQALLELHLEKRLKSYPVLKQVLANERAVK